MTSTTHDQTGIATRYAEERDARSSIARLSQAAPRTRSSASSMPGRGRRGRVAVSAIAAVALAIPGLIGVRMAVDSGPASPRISRPAVADTTLYGYYLRP